MIETTIMLKDEKAWPKVDIKNETGKVIDHRARTPDELMDAMNAAGGQIPGLNHMPGRCPLRLAKKKKTKKKKKKKKYVCKKLPRIDMLATGIKTPVGIKIAGPNLAELERVASEVEAVVKGVPGTLSAFAERTMGGNYIEFNIDRDAIARYGLTIGDVQDVLEVALGGMPLTTTVEGLERYDVNLRYSRDFRENLGALREIVVPTKTGAQVPLGQLAKIETVHALPRARARRSSPAAGGVAMGDQERSRPVPANAWIYVDVKESMSAPTYRRWPKMRAVNAAT